ncbi:MAG: A/G-specific adenine glycosylase [Bdellovibrionales bacterium]|nr:A/G-specific adenine glycosylase [Bdellovibrionales bacterium]
MTTQPIAVLKPIMKPLVVKKLETWFLKHQRDLPWRQDQDPYKVWISETMLQQTTSQAVIGYFQRFLKRFPSLKSLSESSIEEVYEMWAGLGYYSRARNLHKAAMELYKDGGFNNQSYKDLIKYPGFGPYTSRSLSSIAFEEPVGVLDGNVIRVLSRYHNFKAQWWKTTDKNKLQELSDQSVQGFSSRVINQALMELGATICTPTNPKCLICPVSSSCKAFKAQTQEELPLKKPKKQHKLIYLNFYIYKQNNQLALEKNSTSPFLKGQLLPPHDISEPAAKPKEFDFQHSITHYKIFVKINKVKSKPQKTQLYPIKDIKKLTPSSLVDKILKNY